MKVLQFLNKRIEEIIIVACLGVMTISIGLQVFMRYVVQASLSWSEELARYLFIFFVYAGISYGVKMKRHVRVEAFTMWLSPRKQAIIKLVSDILFLAFALFIIYYGFVTAGRIFRLNQTSPALEIRMGYVYGTLPFCFILVAIRLLQNLYHSVKELASTTEGGE
ncbi:MAG: TRAP transporter small permease [Planctomycetaceae bacterium]|nr:TRAP transporter small permease [Planctomycetaceae bacterium]